MANYDQRRIVPADSLLFDSRGNLVGLRSGTMGDQKIFGLNEADYKATQALASGAGFLVDPGTTTELATTPWTPALAAAARLWYTAEDALTAAGVLAIAGDAVQTVPNRITAAVSRTDSLPMPLVARATALGVGGTTNRPIKRNGNLLNGFMPLSFGAVVSGGSTMRLATQLGALSTPGVHRIFIVAALRGTAFPYLMNVSSTAGSGLSSGNGARQIRVGTDNQIVGAFADSTPFLLSYERAGTEPLFDNAVAVSSVLARINGVRTATHTAATSQETADQAFLIGNRNDTDAATDLDFWEVIVCEGKMVQADIYRVEGYLAHKYALATSLPGDHPYRSAPPTAPVGSTTRSDFDVVTAPWGYRQVVQGYLFEMQSDNISANDGAQGTDFSRAIPYDLKPSERKRLAQLVKGAHSIRLALGLYYRGTRTTNGTSSLTDGIGPRLPSQRQHLWEFMQTAGLAGIAPEYWSPAPHWKTTSDWGLGTLWAGGANSRATTLDSIRTTGPTITGVTKANPGVVTYSGTDPSANVLVYIAGVAGMTQLNGRFFRIASLNTGTKTFALTDSVTGANIDTSGYGVWTSGGTLGFDYAAQIGLFTTSIVADLEDLHGHDTYPMRVVAFGLQNEPLGTPAAYGSCTYTGQGYLDVMANLIPKIRNSAILSKWGGNPNTVAIHATSWGGPADTIGATIVADATVLSTGKTVAQELAYWTVHQISTFNANANAMLTSTGTSSTTGGQPYYNYRVAAFNPTGAAVVCNEYEFFTDLGRPAQFANLCAVWINFLNWMQAPLVTLIHASKPTTDVVAERYALTAWRVPGDNAAAVSTDYASGLDYGEFGVNDVNYNAALPFIRWLKGAQWLQVHEAAYSTTRKVGACYTADGKLVVMALNLSTSAANMSIGIGREIRRMRPLNYSATQRDSYASGGSLRGNRLDASVPAQTLQVWVEC